TLGRALATAGLERKVRVLGKTLTLHPQATVNGAPADPDATLPDRARVEWRRWPDLGEVLSWAGVPHGARPLVDGIEASDALVLRDGAVVELASDAALEPGPGIVADVPAENVEDVPGEMIPVPAAPALRQELTVLVNGDPFVLERPAPRGFGAESPVLLVDLLPR